MTKKTNPYAIGMAKAMKLKKDKPPLEKETIVKAHDIARNIKKGKKKVSEKWEGKAEIKATGEYAGKSLKQLQSMLDDLKKSGPHKAGSAENKKMKQLMFAIRAKKHWKGGVKKESTEKLDEAFKLRKFVPGLGKLQAASKANAQQNKADFVRSVSPAPDQDTLVKKYQKNANRYRKIANESPAGNTHDESGLFEDERTRKKHAMKVMKQDFDFANNIGLEILSQEDPLLMIAKINTPKQADQVVRRYNAMWSTGHYSMANSPWPMMYIREGLYLVVTVDVQDGKKLAYQASPAANNGKLIDRTDTPIKSKELSRLRSFNSFNEFERNVLNKSDAEQLNELSPEKYGQVAKTAKNRIIDLKRALETAKKIGDTESAKRYEDAIAHYEGLAGKASEKHSTGISQRKLGIAKSRGTKLLPSKLRQEITTEADRPLDGDQLGPGSFSGRGNVLESKTKKRINENMNTCEAAYHEGKSHGLSKHNYACRYNEGSDEHRRYHEGYKEGLDECYGLQPNRGLVDETIDDEMVETISYMDDNDLPPITDDDEIVDDMASYGAEESDVLDEMETELDEVSRGQWLKQQDRKAERAGKSSFNAFGQTFSTADIDEAFTFESLEKQLNALLNEDTEVSEGLNVSMSKGLPSYDGKSSDSVSVTATDDDAGKLLDFIKQVGLGGLGSDSQPAQGAAIVSVSDYGAPAFNGHDDMKSMMSKMTVDGDQDYKEEDSEEGEQHHHQPEVCTECGMNETKCQCDEEVLETETQDQETEEVAEDDAGDSGQLDAGKSEAERDSALALGSENEEHVDEENTNSKKKLDELSPELLDRARIAADRKLNIATNVANQEWQAKHPGRNPDMPLIGRGKNAEEKFRERQSAKFTDAYWDAKEKKELRSRMSPAAMRKAGISEEEAALNEWANEAGKDGTEASFQRDIDFMTKVISGGLNKPKSTGQQTVPVLAQDEKRTVDHVDDWMKLAGIKK